MERWAKTRGREQVDGGGEVVALAGVADPSTTDPDVHPSPAPFAPTVPRCTATANRTGEPCRNPAVSGTTVCGTHGGRAPQVRAAARRRLVEAEAERELAKVEVRPIGDPVVELADVAAQALALLEWAKAKAAGDGAESSDRLAILERALDRAGKLLEACGRLGLEERRVRLDEDRLDLMARVMSLAWQKLGNDPDGPEVQAALEASYAELSPGPD